MWLVELERQKIFYKICSRQINQMEYLPIDIRAHIVGWGLLGSSSKTLTREVLVPLGIDKIGVKNEKDGETRRGEFDRIQGRDPRDHIHDNTHLCSSMID